MLVLVNNAGHTDDGLAIRMRSEQWDAVISVNLSGAFNCTRRALRSMLPERFGRIVNISSVVPSAATRARPTTPPPRRACSASPARSRARWRARA